MRFLSKFRRRLKSSVVGALAGCVVFSPLLPAVKAQQANLPAKANIVAKLNFNPKVNGFGFQNYTNSKHQWQDDIGAADMIKMFGAAAVCKTGSTAKDCVLKAAAREWMMQKLEAAGGGHCEGMAVASLRFATSKVFKGKAAATQFQTAAKTPFQLILNPEMENYIAYYWVTQTLQEINGERRKSMLTSPVAVVNQLIEGFKAGRDTYPLSFWKFANGKYGTGHSVSPFAVEDKGTYYSIHVYDNNYPGQTRYIIVEKAGKQNWKYITSSNPTEPPSAYAGNVDTKSIGVSPTSLRDKGCFKVPFAADGKGGTCVPVKDVLRKPAPARKPVEYTAPVRPKKPAAPKKVPAVINNVPVKSGAEYDESYFYEGEMAEFALNGNADMLVIDGEGYGLGYDPTTDQFVDEIPYSDVQAQLGGRGFDAPLYRVPFQYEGDPYTILISGKYNKRETNVDFTYTGPGFTIGFDGILVDPNEIIAVTISPDGEQISFTSSADGETPEIYYAVDNGEVSSKFELDGGKLKPGKTLTVNYNIQNNIFNFYDNDGDDDKYDVDYTRYNSDGTEWYYETDNIDFGTADSYQMDFSEWEGTGAVGVKADDEGDGFDDDEYVAQAIENNDDDPDDADDEGDDEDSDVDNDGKLNDADTDDDNDGTLDAKDSDDDNDGLSDSEDQDTDDDDGDGQEDAEDTDDDGDGTTDEKDTDDDNDGTLDEDENGEYNEAGDEDEAVDDADDDNDGTPDAKDTDDDNDGISDGEDEDTTDDDGDGQEDEQDADDDNDGKSDEEDTDDDNDGTTDEDEESGDEEAETVNDDDDDDDGVPDAEDNDDDNDGESDGEDVDTTDDDGDGKSDAEDTDDDGDGTPDAEDADDDNDGEADSEEADNDADNDGVSNDEDADDDGDGTADETDADDDNDGTPDAEDADDDNDGEPDAEEDGDGDEDGGNQTAAFLTRLFSGLS